MMIYRRKNKEGHGKRTALIAVIVLIAILGFFKITFIHDVLGVVVSPLAGVQSAIRTPFIHIASYFTSHQQLQDRIAALQEENAALKLDSLQREILEAENRELRSLTDASSAEELLLAKILTRPPYSPYDTLVINKGANDNLQAGTAIFYKDVFLGAVADISPSTSVVRLISSASVETQVHINANISGVAVGQGGGRLIITLPKDTAVATGDIVTLSDAQASIIGVVSHIVVDEVDSFQTLHVSLPISLNAISFVEIAQ